MAGIEIDDREAVSDQERQDSRILLDALQARRTQIGGEAAVPDDAKLSASILDAARKRSAEISRSRAASVRLETPAQAIPWWLWVAWPAAISAVALLFWWLHGR